MSARARISRFELQLLSGAAWSILGAAIGRALLLGAGAVSGRVVGVVAFGKLGMVQSTAVLFGAVIGASLSLAALAEAISAYLGSAALRARHGAAARERLLRHFSQGVVWRAMYREYETALQRRGLSHPAGAPVPLAPPA